MGTYGRGLWVTVVVLSVSLLFGGCGGSETALDHAPVGVQPSVLGETLQVPDGVSPELMGELASALEQQLVAQGGHGVRDVTGIFIDPLARSDQGADVLINWGYNNTGDYDQNSEVNVADLTPIGINFGLTIADPEWPFARVADGDGNGEINIADITPIGANFGSVVSNYVIESDIDGAGDWRAVANVRFSEGLVPIGSGLMQFGGTVPFGSQCPVAGTAGFRVFAGPEASPLFEFPDLGWSATLTVAPHSGYAPLETFCNVSFADDNGPFDVVIDFDDGTPDFTDTSIAGGDVFTQHAFASIGTYNVTATITNTGVLGGELLSSQTVNVIPFDASQVVDFENWVDYDLQTGEGWGKHSALAMVNGMPMIVYTRDDRDEIYFARATNPRPETLTDWVQMEVDDTGTLGGKLDIAQIQDVPCIVYEERIDQDLFYAHATSGVPNSAADWVIHEVNTDEPLREEAQLANMGGKPAIAYVTGGGIRYAISNLPTGSQPTDNAHWDYEDIDTDGFMAFPQIVAPFGLPVVAYQRADGGWLELRYAYKTSQVDPWTILTIDDLNKNSGKNIRMELVGDMGAPEVALAYQNVDIVDYLRYTHINSWNPTSSSDWQTMTVRSQAQTHIGQWLGLNWFNGRPVMAYVNTGSGSEPGLNVSIANVSTPAGPDDFIHGKLDDAEGYFVNEQTSILRLDDSTLFILYRTSLGLRFAYFSGS